MRAGGVDVRWSVPASVRALLRALGLSDDQRAVEVGVGCPGEAGTGSPAPAREGEETGRFLMEECPIRRDDILLQIMEAPL